MITEVLSLVKDIRYRITSYKEVLLLCMHFYYEWTSVTQALLLKNTTE